jgi:hypothetical protein
VKNILNIDRKIGDFLLKYERSRSKSSYFEVSAKSKDKLISIIRKYVPSHNLLKYLINIVGIDTICHNFSLNERHMESILMNRKDD